ncbi:MAG TPA: sigma-70 family RNA polymerase sigma factor [Vicinamibacterales bacterium]|jgi:RNA polymerase sigma-70 factor (ECF subfamily)
MEMHVRGGEAAIALSGLKIALQTGSGNLYDTSRRSIPYSGPSIAMDDPRVGDAPLGDSRLADTSGLPGVESTFDLVERAKKGDREALNQLFARFLPALRRWASGRLPRWTRDLMDTDDLVQETVFRAVKRMDSFESRHEGALQAYLRQAIVNRIRDEVRRTKRSPVATELDDNQTDHSDSPLEMAIGHEALERYEAALARLRPEEREAIVARVEMDGSYQQVAQALGKPSADAARMAVSRALLRLAEEMNRGQE